MRRRLRASIWLALALSALVFLAYSIPREPFRETIANVRWTWILMGTMFFFVSQGLLAFRWQLLLRVQGVSISLFQAIKLTYLGLFYNNIMPGAVGGDILKAWYITHHSGKNLRVQAAMTVFVDRLVGLFGIIVPAAVVSLFIGSEIAYAGIEIRWLVWGIFATMAGGAVVFLSKRIRRFMFISQFVDKLPFAKMLRKINGAIWIYRRHLPMVLWVLALNTLIQALAIAAIWMLTQGLHFERVTFLHCIIIIPIVWVIGAAIPVPAGLGIIESLITYLFCLVINPEDPGAATGQAAALALLNRLMLCACSLPGALVPVFGGHLPRFEEMAAERGQSAELSQ